MVFIHLLIVYDSRLAD